MASLQTTVPSVDMADLLDQHNPSILAKRQAMPEIAQDIYKIALRDECAIGDYTDAPENFVVMTGEVRLYMMTVIVEVHRIKKYKEETLYLATSLADRYLALLTIL